MSFWIAAGLLSIATLFFLAAPLWRKSKEALQRAEYDMNVFKDQLKELDRDVERAMISPQEAGTARIEIQRRLLAADEARTTDQVKLQGSSMTSLILSVCIGTGVVVGSFAVYNVLGNPGYEDVPFASRDLQKERHQANEGQMANAISMLRKRLEKDATDIDSWVLLGRTLRSLDRLDEALIAFRNAIKHSNRHPAILADFAEAKIYANSGEVDPETLNALRDAIQQDPTQLKARFYLGYAKVRLEDYKGAIQTWTDLLAMAPTQAGWISQVHEQIKKAAQAGGLKADDFAPSSQAKVLAKQLKLEWENDTPSDQDAPSPSREDMQAASEMSAQDRSSMILSMVERLADKLKENPNDLEGWKRLARAYQVLGKEDKVREAEAKIRKLEAQ